MVDIQEIIGYVIAAVTLGIIFLFVILMARVDEDLKQSESASQVIERVTVSSLPIGLRFNFIDNGSVTLINVSTDANNDTIPTGDYAIDGGGGVIRSMNNTDWGPTVYANYTYSVQNPQFNITQDVHTSSSNFSTVAAGAAVVMALLIIAIILFGVIGIRS